MSHAQVFRRIVLPQALLTAAPSLVNQFTVVVKSSTLVSVITVPDLMFQSRKEIRERIMRADRSAHGDGGGMYSIALILSISQAGKYASDWLRGTYGLQG